MSDSDRSPTDEILLQITPAQQQQAMTEIGSLLKERVMLKQSLAIAQEKSAADAEQLLLELLEVFDAIESLINYLETNPQLSEKAIARLPKSVGSIRSKLLITLARRDVKPIEFTATQPDINVCQVLDARSTDEVTEPTITKIVRQGFNYGEKLLRPIEVTIDKPMN
jgi:molecular chaperone GrpE